jgi:hypothetical protein
MLQKSNLINQATQTNFFEKHTRNSVHKDSVPSVVTYAAKLWLYGNETKHTQGSRNEVLVSSGIKSVGFKVLIAVSMKMAVFWVVAP